MPRDTKKKKEEVRFVLRMPTGLWRKLGKAAKNHRWSLNTSVIAAIEAFVEKEKE